MHGIRLGVNRVATRSMCGNQCLCCVVLRCVPLTVCRLRKQLAGEEGEAGGRPKDPEAAGQDDKGRRLVGLESNSVGTYAECYPGYVTDTHTHTHNHLSLLCW